MKITNKKLTDLTPYAHNPRINDGAVEAVENSIREFGFLVPIVVDKAGTIVAGHTRYKAAQFLGLSEVPTVDAGNLTDKQIQAFRLADNKTAELAEWDFEKLKAELDELADFDMPLFGFTDAENNNLFSVDKNAFDEQGLLDEKEPITCPYCKKQFQLRH